MKQIMKNHSVAIICPPTVTYYFEAAGEVFGRAVHYETRILSFDKSLLHIVCDSLLETPVLKDGVKQLPAEPSPSTVVRSWVYRKSCTEKVDGSTVSHARADIFGMKGKPHLPVCMFWFLH